jgi:hypothetical protein
MAVRSGGHIHGRHWTTRFSEQIEDIDQLLTMNVWRRCAVSF